MDLSQLIQPREYSLPAPLVQAICDLLVELPAKTSRGLLNQIEAHCQRQDQQRQEKAREALAADIRKEVAAEAEKKRQEGTGKNDAPPPGETGANGGE